MNWPDDYTNKIICGDCLEVMKEMPDESVPCVITSPPYWGLRDYGLEPLVWGGKEDCEHDFSIQTEMRRNRWQAEIKNSPKQKSNLGCITEAEQGQFCQLCGAWLGNLGLEPTPELYVEHIVEICRGIKRVLRKDGTFWLNMGDSYASGKGTCFNPGGGAQSLGQNKKEMGAHPLDRGNVSTLRESGLKPKDLCGMPWRVAFALQTDGWWLRSDIIWSKPNSMPESVTDRPTHSHEYVFLLTKSKNYYYDQDAIREKQSDLTMDRIKYHRFSWRGKKNTKREGKPGFGPNRLEIGGRNKRSVWTIATQPFPEAHFATFPPDLVRPMIQAGTSAYGACSKCGAPWERIVEKGFTGHTGKTKSQYKKGSSANRLALLRQAARETGEEYINQSKTIGWKPTCECRNVETVPCVVLDPCIGSGTVAEVAMRLGRDFIGIDLKQEYIEMTEKRLKPYRNQLKLALK